MYIKNGHWYNKYWAGNYWHAYYWPGFDVARTAVLRGLELEEPAKRPQTFEYNSTWVLDIVLVSETHFEKFVPKLKVKTKEENIELLFFDEDLWLSEN